MADENNAGGRILTPEELDAAMREAMEEVPECNMIINGKPLRELTDQELAQALIFFKMKHAAVDEEFSAAHAKHMSFHGARAAALFEYDRRKNSGKLISPDGKTRL